MCGITGYIGHRDSVPVLLKGLRRLEYRGYDSAGIALLQDNKIAQLKKAGKVSDLQSLVDDSPIKGNCGIAHTRWATHGEPNDINAHPHLDQTGNIALVHNGIIENFNTLKEVLIDKGVYSPAIRIRKFWFSSYHYCITRMKQSVLKMPCGQRFRKWLVLTVLLPSVPMSQIP